MIEKIRSHIDALFKDAPDTRRVQEAREELLAGCQDKYADLTLSGRTPEEAYVAVISGIGDVDELLRAIGQMDAADPRQEQTQRKKRAFFISAGVFLYVLSLAVAAIVDQYVAGHLTGAVFLLLVAAATFVLLYGVMSTRVKVEKPSVSLSGEIQAQLAGDGRDDKLFRAVSSSLWSFITLAYLCAGFFAGWWHPGWLVFPFGSVLQLLIKMALGGPKNIHAHLSGLIWTATVFVYLVLSFLTGRWDVTWLVFLLTLSAWQVWKLIGVWRDSDEK